jgi:hypothetical protein
VPTYTSTDSASLFKKKDKLNYKLYKAHMKAAQEWGGIIRSTIHDFLDKEMEKKYNSLDKKIKKASADPDK